MSREDRLGRMVEAGRISEQDAEEVRRFWAYLEALAAAGITTPLRRTDPTKVAGARAIYLEHYPEHAPPPGAA